MDQKARLEKAREIQGEIGRILLRHWDPVGVRDEPRARDEYDHYVGGVYRLLASGASPEAVAEHLCAVEAEWMGLAQARPGNLLPVAAKLCSLDVRLQEK